MKFYQSTTSPNSRRVRIFLAEKGIQLDVVPVDLGAKEQFSSAYRAINPRLQVPALVLADGTSIAEVPAIWRFLDETHPGRRCWARRLKKKRLLPGGSAERNLTALPR